MFLLCLFKLIYGFKGRIKKLYLTNGQIKLHYTIGNILDFTLTQTTYFVNDQLMLTCSLTAAHR